MANGKLRAQGATEYLVMLGIALIVALVVVSLINFYPGTVSDSQMAENQLYWRNAKPLAIYDITAAGYAAGGAAGGAYSNVSFVVKNVGDYPIKINRILGSNASGASGNATRYVNSAGDYIPLNSMTIAPGKTVCFGMPPGSPACPQKLLRAKTATPSVLSSDFGAKQSCSPDGTGFAMVENFGIEYAETIGTATITKQETGQRFIAKCVK
jgi:hypothetical protein